MSRMNQFMENKALEFIVDEDENQQIFESITPLLEDLQECFDFKFYRYKGILKLEGVKTKDSYLSTFTKPDKLESLYDSAYFCAGYNFKESYIDKLTKNNAERFIKGIKEDS